MHEFQSNAATMKHKICTAIYPILFFVLACQAEDPSQLTSTRSISPILESSFSRPSSGLDKKFFQENNPYLTDEDFETKWQEATLTPLLFFRSFPQAFYRDMSDIDLHSMPGEKIFCFGDAHPENFGFIQISNDSYIFDFNDLDDSGPCPVAVDGLRYFTALSLYENNPDLVDKVIDYYAASLGSKQKVSHELPVIPDFEAVRSREIRRFTEDGKLNRSNQKRRLQEIEKHEFDEIAQLFKSDHRLSHLEIIDVMRRERAAGGSGGLKRYWVLVDQLSKDGKDSRTDIIELKQAEVPATQWGHFDTAVKNRVDQAKEIFWKEFSDRDYFEVDLFTNESYLVRSRTTKLAIDLEELSKKQKMELYQNQVTIMALHHGSAYNPDERRDLSDWLKKSVRTLHERYVTVLNELKRFPDLI